MICSVNFTTFSTLVSRNQIKAIGTWRKLPAAEDVTSYRKPWMDVTMTSLVECYPRDPISGNLMLKKRKTTYPSTRVGKALCGSRLPLDIFIDERMGNKTQRKYVSGVFQFLHRVFTPQHLSKVKLIFFPLFQSEVCFDITFFFSIISKWILITRGER